MEIYTYQQSDTLNIFNNYIATRDKVIKYLHSHKITKEYGVDIFSQIKKIVSKNIHVNLNLEIMLNILTENFSGYDQLRKFPKVQIFKTHVLRSLRKKIIQKQSIIVKLIKNTEIKKNQLLLVLQLNQETSSRDYNESETLQLYHLITQIINYKLQLLSYHPLQYNESELINDIIVLKSELKTVYKALEIFELLNSYVSNITQNVSNVMIFENNQRDTLQLKVKEYNLLNSSPYYKELMNNYTNVSNLLIKINVELFGYENKKKELNMCSRLSHLRLEYYTILKLEPYIQRTVKKLLILQSIIQTNEEDIQRLTSVQLFQEYNKNIIERDITTYIESLKT